MKGPHFFCESCGAEVPLAARICPRCGKSFQAVRCPECGFVGEEALFSQGCPVCGFTVAPSPAKRAKFAGNAAGKPRRWETAEALPLWVYLLAAVFFIGVCGILAAILRN
jgi:hypothetical protein